MTTTVNQRREAQLPIIIWVILIVLGLGGLGGAWILQLIQGMGVTGLGQQVVWGLYIAGFFTAMGGGAALVALATLSEFSILVPVARRRSVLLLALVNFVIGGLLIAMDVGNPINVWRILTAGRFTSMMTWDFLALFATGILTFVYLIVSWRQAAATTLTRTFGILALIGAALLVVVEGWMLSIIAARPLWSGGLTTASFLVAAFVAGLSIAMLAWPDIDQKLGNWLKIGLWGNLAIVLIEVLTGAIEKDMRPHLEVNQLLTGAFSPMFWTYLIGGLLAPLAVLLWRKELLWLRVASVLALLGVIAEKLWLLSAGQALPWLALPEGFYSPTLIEFLGVVGGIALGILIYRFLIMILKVE